MGTEEIRPDELVDIIINNDFIGKGNNGSVITYYNGEVLKLYNQRLRQLFKYIYSTKNDLNRNTMISKLLNDLMELKTEEELMQSSNPNLFNSTLDKRVKHLKRLMKLGYVNSSVTCMGEEIGITLPNYRDYIPISYVFDRLNSVEKSMVFNLMEEQLYKLMDKCIYPCNIDEGDFLINRSSLDVRIIDIDDETTVYDDLRDSVYHEMSGKCIKKLSKVIDHLYRK